MQTEVSSAGLIEPTHLLADEFLARRAPQDLDAFGELYRRHLCPLFRFVRAQVPSDAVAEDVTALVFFKALSASDTYRGEASYRSWLYRIAQNAVSSWRARSRRDAIAVDRVPEEADPAPSPATQAISKEARGTVRRAVASLPPAQREVVVLHYLEDLTTEEVAAATDRTAGAVRILLHRARNRLRKAFDEERPS